MVSSITLLVQYGLLVIWTCLLRPAGSMVWFIVRYLGGRTPWATPTTSVDPSPPPNWCSPESPRPWASLYVQKEVRGRGLEHRQPRDLLVCHEGADARLRHGPPKGRTNRKGYVCPYEEVLGCSNRSFRRRLETMPMQVHLCAHSPCNDPGAAAVHIACSASVGRTTEYDLQEMARRGPWRRAWRVAVWASYSLAALGPFLRPCPRRLAPRHRPDVDPNSETDTDTEDKPCQAHLVALWVSGSVVALCEGQCSDSARGEPIAFLLEDPDRSATSELGSSRPRCTFEGCPTHRNAYAASRATLACSRVGCPRAKTHVRERIPLCDEHLRPSVTWHDKPPAIPPTRARSPSPGRIAPAAELPEDLGPASSQAWIQWSEPSHLAAQAYFAFSYQLMGRATDSTRQNLRMSIYIPDLDLTFSVLSDLAAGGINAGQAEQMALSRAPVIVDPWNGKPGHNQHGNPLPYAAAQSLTWGEFPEGYAVHHLGRVLPADEQPQPATPRASSRDPVFPSAESGTPRASADPTTPDFQAL